MGSAHQASLGSTAIYASFLSDDPGCMSHVRSCPFCGSRANSREHVWPKWISRHYLDGASSRAFFTMNAGGGPAGGRRTARELNQTIRVCRACNSGWMSQLEAKARPPLLRLITGQRIVLTPDESLIVAQWLCKMVVVHEGLADAHHQISTPQQRAQVAAGVPPPTWLIRIGRVSDFETTFTFRFGNHRTFLDGPEAGHRATTILLRFEAFVGQVLVNDLHERPEVDGMLGGEKFSVDAPTAEAISWPPQQALRQDWLEIVQDVIPSPNVDPEV